jgi:hypothetical protein
VKLNRKHFAELFRTDYYTVGVKFADDPYGRNPKEYTYKVPKSMNLVCGDRVLVCVPNDLSKVQELKVTTVQTINREPEIESNVGFDYKWIVAKFDDVTADYVSNIEKDKKLKRAVHKLESAMERAMLRVQLADALKELSEDDALELSQEFGLDINAVKKLT